MIHRPRPVPRLAAIIAFALMTILAAAGPSTTMAQESSALQEEADVTYVRGALCADAACSEYADFIAPFTINAIDETAGELLDSCTFDVGLQDPYCGIEFDSSIPHVFTWDDTEVPEGYTYIGERIEETGPDPNGVPVTTFAFVPDGDEPPAEPDTTWVRAALCTDETCDEYAELLDGFEITAVDVFSDEALDSCLTDTASQFQGCTLELPGDPTYHLTWNEADVPEGYVSEGGPVIDDQGPGPDVSTLRFIPEDADDDAPITGLPETGGGPVVSRVSSDTAFAALALFSGASVAGAIRVVAHGRRR